MVRSHRDHASAVHIQTNVLVVRPFLITPQFIISWPAGWQHTHTAHSIVGANEAAGSDNQPFNVVLVFMLGGHLYTPPTLSSPFDP
ncbi:MAG: hypothetical protein K0Q89_3081 [Thermomicrobiales bacterium]|nr:hypothetical protein [Thermomicrobiales bacterium]